MEYLKRFSEWSTKEKLIVSNNAIDTTEETDNTIGTEVEYNYNTEDDEVLYDQYGYEL